MLPTADDIRRIDAILALDGVSVLDRPDAAVFKWIEEQTGRGEILPIATAFREGFRELHPSQDFYNRPFMYLCVSALGTAYALHPPVVFGASGINPINFVKISKPEVERIFSADSYAFWEMEYQAADGIDLFLFLSGMNASPRIGQAAEWAEVGQGQLQAAARQLVASAKDASLPQSVALIAEMMVKSALAKYGMPESEIKKVGHDISCLYKMFVQSYPDVNDGEVLSVASTIPAYADARYHPPPQNARQSQDLYRRALFLSAETARRGQRTGIYRQIAADHSIPARRWIGLM